MVTAQLIEVERVLRATVGCIGVDLECEVWTATADDHVATVMGAFRSQPRDTAKQAAWPRVRPLEKWCAQHSGIHQEQPGRHADDELIRICWMLEDGQDGLILQRFTRHACGSMGTAQVELMHRR